MIYRIGQRLRLCAGSGVVTVTTLIVVSAQGWVAAYAAERFARHGALYVRSVTFARLLMPLRSPRSPAEHQPHSKLRDPPDDRQRALQPHPWPDCAMPVCMRCPAATLHRKHKVRGRRL